jgi:putative FmdB family regulatory protein
MPRYDFTCQECGHVFTEIILLNDPEPVLCPKCKTNDVFRHFPAPAVHVFYSPAHPRHNRGMKGHKIMTVKPQFRDDAPFLKKKKKTKKNA